MGKLEKLRKDEKEEEKEEERRRSAEERKKREEVKKTNESPEAPSKAAGEEPPPAQKMTGLSEQEINDRLAALDAGRARAQLPPADERGNELARALAAVARPLGGAARRAKRQAAPHVPPPVGMSERKHCQINSAPLRRYVTPGRFTNYTSR